MRIEGRDGWNPAVDAVGEGRRETSRVCEDRMDWNQHITVDPAVLAGKPVIKGTRISVEFILDLVARGWTSAQILEEYDHLTLDDVKACRAYRAGSTG